MEKNPESTYVHTIPIFTPIKIDTTKPRQKDIEFQGIESRIGFNFSTDDLKAPLTALNGSSSSVNSGINTKFSYINIDQNDFSVKNSTQFY